jgi:hypothetical protein
MGGPPPRDGGIDQSDSGMRFGSTPPGTRTRNLQGRTGRLDIELVQDGEELALPPGVALSVPKSPSPRRDGRYCVPAASAAGPHRPLPRTGCTDPSITRLHTRSDSPLPGGPAAGSAPPPDQSRTGNRPWPPTHSSRWKQLFVFRSSMRCVRAAAAAWNRGAFAAVKAAALTSTTDSWAGLAQ